MKIFTKIIAAAALALTFGGAFAQEAAISKILAERLPSLPKIDEIRKTAMPGLYEIRVNGNEIFYTDAEGNYLIQGSLIDTKAKRNLTEERVEKLNAVAFDDLPMKDAFKIVHGNGKRKMAVFEDPNCTYCKRFERDMQKVQDVTLYVFLYPILGASSVEKAENVWCAKDRGKAWQDMMLLEQTPPKASCDTSVLARNVEFGKKVRINGTPTLFFVDGSRVPGAINAQQVEKILSEAKAP
jgi:thiol:disulfide interchange protein DsbC